MKEIKKIKPILSVDGLSCYNSKIEIVFKLNEVIEKINSLQSSK